MANIAALRTRLEALGYQTSYFATAQEAADYLNGQLDGTSVAFGGSMTLLNMGLYERLQTHNTVLWHWKGDTLPDAAGAKVYLSSVNALAETGEIINIDGTCNRVGGTLYGHEKVYLVVGANKIAPDYESALFRARNVAAPLNARRLDRKTPCATGSELKCYNCSSPERICRALTVLWRKPGGAEYEIVLVDESMGF